MKWPDSAKNMIAKSFYDKTVTVLEKATTIGPDGGAKFCETTKSTFKGNVRFNALGEVQEELGLVENIDIVITCPTDTAVGVDDFLQYGGVKYTVSDVVPSDSHLTVVGKKWAASK